MFTSLQKFDPLVFLSVDTNSLSSPDEVNALREDLNKKIGEYILIKLSGGLTEEQMNEILAAQSGSEILNKLVTVVPELEQKVLQEIENFKTDYQKEMQ